MQGKKVIASSAAAGLAVVNAYSLAWLPPSYLFELLRGKRFRNLLFYIIPLLCGVGVLVWYWYQTGDFRTYFTVEADIWKVRFTDPVTRRRPFNHGPGDVRSPEFNRVRRSFHAAIAW